MFLPPPWYRIKKKKKRTENQFICKTILIDFLPWHNWIWLAFGFLKSDWNIESNWNILKWFNISWYVWNDGQKTCLSWSDRLPLKLGRGYLLEVLRRGPPANKKLFTGGLSANKKLFTKGPLANKKLFAGGPLENTKLYAGALSILCSPEWSYAVLSCL